MKENKNKNIRTPIISAEHCSALIGTRVIYLGFEKVFRHKQRHINSYISNHPPPPIHVTNKANYNEVITQVISSSTGFGFILHKHCHFSILQHFRKYIATIMRGYLPEKCVSDTSPTSVEAEKISPEVINIFQTPASHRNS